MALNGIRKLNIALTAFGSAVFGALLLFLLYAPESFAQRTAEFAVSQVRAEVDDVIANAAQSEAAGTASAIAGAFSENLQQRIEGLRSGLDSGLDKFVAAVLVSACELDCGRREQARQEVEAFYNSILVRYGLALERVEEIVVGEYDRVMTELSRDVTIFSASNFISLFVAFLLSIFRGPAARHLLPVSICLTLATALAIAWYALGQDWVMTIIFSNYWGWSYLGFISVLLAVLIDIAINRARITSEVLNAVSGLFGSGGFSPC